MSQDDPIKLSCGSRSLIIKLVRDLGQVDNGANIKYLALFLREMSMSQTDLTKLPCDLEATVKVTHHQTHLRL